MLGFCARYKLSVNYLENCHSYGCFRSHFCSSRRDLYFIPYEPFANCSVSINTGLCSGAHIVKLC